MKKISLIIYFTIIFLLLLNFSDLNPEILHLFLNFSFNLNLMVDKFEQDQIIHIDSKSFNFQMNKHKEIMHQFYQLN